MKSVTIALFVSFLLFAGCENKSTPPSKPPPVAPAAPKQKEKVRLEISEMGIDEQGHLQVKVQNHTSLQLDLVNISWFFYGQNGNPIMVAENPQYQKTVITTKAKDDSDSTVVDSGKSKTFYNELTTVDRIFGGSLSGVGSAQIKIYIMQSTFEALNLDTDIPYDETESSIRQVFDSPRFALEKVATFSALPINKQQILDSAMQKAREGRFTEMTPHEMDAFRESRLQVANEHDQAIKTRQEIAQSKFPQKERDVYHYMRDRYDAIAVSSSGYDPDRDDELVLSEAATKFGISKQEATTIYMKLDAAGLDFK